MHEIDKAKGKEKDKEKEKKKQAEKVPVEPVKDAPKTDKKK